MADKMLKITLVKSPIGAVPKNRAVVEAMGLRKLNKTVLMPDNDATRGMIKKVGYMLKVEEGVDNGITYEILKESADDVIPISKSSKEQILALERWANDRALYANDESKTKEKQAKIKPLFKSKPIE